MNTKPAPSFTLMASTRGAFGANFVFENQDDFINWISTKYPEIRKKYGKIDIRLSSIDPLNVGDTCFVAGEGSDQFVIQGWRKIEDNRYSFALDNGCWEEVAKCFKKWSRPTLPQSMKIKAHKLGFSTVKMQENYIIFEN